MKNILRLRRKAKIKRRIAATTERMPRLSVFRSNTNIYAQIIDEKTSKTLVSVSDLKMKREGTKSDMSKKVGEEIAKLALEKDIKEVVFDRNGFSYNGRVKALAESAKEKGLKF